MTRQVVFTPRAEHHLESLYRYIEAQTGTIRAEAFTERIVAYCRELAQFPERGMRRDDLLPGLRIVGYRRRISIAFIVAPQAVVILGVYYGGRDYEADLRGRKREGRT